MTTLTGGRRHRVGVNLLWLVPGVVGGSEEYTTRGLAGLAERQPDDLDIALFALAPFAEAHPDLAAAYETVTLPIDGRHKPVRVAAESSWLAAQARRHELHLFHHAGGVVPAVGSVPAVVTVHDLQPLVMPENFSRAKLTYLRTMLPRSARAARLIVTPSDHARRSVIDVLGVAPDRVSTVPHGIEALPSDWRPDPDEIARVRRTYGIPGAFFVYPAITYPHKNHVMLVRAFARVVDSHPNTMLVLTGGAAQSEQVVAAEIDRLRLGDRVRRLGRVPRTDLDALFDAATAVTFPSLFEGFGAPVLEAMERGCPVLAAEATALPEVVGDAGALIPPDRPHEWTEAMTALLDEPHRCARMAAAGRARARSYGWDRTAEALHDAYLRALVDPSLIGVAG